MKRNYKGKEPLWCLEGVTWFVFHELFYWYFFQCCYQCKSYFQTTLKKGRYSCYFLLCLIKFQGPRVMSVKPRLGHPLEVSSGCGENVPVEQLASCSTSSGKWMSHTARTRMTWVEHAACTPRAVPWLLQVDNQGTWVPSLLGEEGGNLLVLSV